jgi:hypothetical protein
LTETSRGVFEVVNATSRTAPRSADDPVTLTTFRMGGFPDVRAASKTAALRMERSEQAATAGKLEVLADADAKATVLVQTHNGDIDAREGTLNVDGDGRIALMNKGSSTKGIYLVAEGVKLRVIGVEPGYGKAPRLANAFNRHAGQVPELEPARFDDIPVCDQMEEPPSEIAAVFMYDHPGFGSGEDGRGSVFFVTDFMPGDSPGEGIVNGYGVYSGESGLTSEHGSMYEKDMRVMGGRVKGYRAGSHTFADAIAFGNAAEYDNDIEACWESVAAASR